MRENGRVKVNTTTARRSADVIGILAQIMPADRIASKIIPRAGSLWEAVASVRRKASSTKIFARGSRRWRPLLPRLHFSRTTWCNSGAPAARHDAADRQARHINEGNSRQTSLRLTQPRRLDARRLIARPLFARVRIAR